MYASLVTLTTATMVQTVDALTIALQMVADVQAAGNQDQTDDNADHHNINSHSPAHQSKFTGYEPTGWTESWTRSNPILSAMTVNVDQCVYGGDEVKLSFEDESCGFASKSGSTWTLSTALDGCGTNVSNSEDKIR